MDLRFQIFNHFDNNVLLVFLMNFLDASYHRFSTFSIYYRYRWFLLDGEAFKTQELNFQEFGPFWRSFWQIYDHLIRPFFVIKDWQKIDQKNWQNSTKRSFFFWTFWSLNHELSILQRHDVPSWNCIFMINNFANAHEALWPIL